MNEQAGNQSAGHKIGVMVLILGLGATLFIQFACHPLNAKEDGLADASMPQLQKLADSGNAEAQYLLGRHLMKGVGVAQNVKAAIDCFRKAAAQKYAPALTSLAELNDEGVGVKENPKEALRLYEEAAALHEPRAECTLGILL